MRSIRFFAVAAVAAGAAALPAAGASAATLHPTKEFTTPDVSVVTTTGARVNLAIDMVRDGGASLDVDLSKGSSSYAEDHDWTFSVNGSVLTYSKGKGSLLTGKQLGPYGSLRLAFTKVAQATRSCRNDNGAATKVTSVKATVKGIVVFKARSSNTQSSKWGVVRKGSSTSKYAFAHRYAHYVTTTNGRCGIPFSQPGGNQKCLQATLWDGPMTGASSVRFVTGDSQQGFDSEVEGVRMVNLSYPSGAMRTDLIAVSAPDPVLDTTGPKPVLTVSTNPGTAASGSATLTANDPPTTQPGQPCTDAGTTKTETIADYENVDYLNGSTPLTVASMVGNDISVPNATGTADFVTFSFA